MEVSVYGAFVVIVLKGFSYDFWPKAAQHPIETFK